MRVVVQGIGEVALQLLDTGLIEEGSCFTISADRISVRRAEQLIVWQYHVAYMPIPSSKLPTSRFSACSPTGPC